MLKTIYQLIILYIVYRHAIHYKIIHNEDSIGYISIIKEIDNDTLLYHSKSEFKLSFFGSRRIQQTSNSTYISSNLLSYQMKSDQNGKNFMRLFCRSIMDIP